MDVDPSTLEKVGVILRKIIYIVAALSLTLACASKVLKVQNVEALKENREFQQRVTIVETPPSPPLTPEASAAPAPVGPPPPVAIGAKKPIVKKTIKKEMVKAPVVPTRRQPELESDIGFQGRRPLVDPFRVGEKVVHSVNYFKMSAGNLTLETRSFAEVNGRKNYQFRTSIKTSSMFSSFYSVDDHVDVLMDFEELVPSVFTLHVRESGQVKEAQMFFDQSKHQATYWEKKVTKKNGEENKKLQWEIPAYAQNVFSAAFYMRVFQWEVGKENSFVVANNEENLIFRGKAVRKERLSTAVGDFDAIVIKPEFELKGKFSPTGDNYIWLSDDNRKLILRIESKIKIGTLVSEVVEIQPGTP